MKWTVSNSPCVASTIDDVVIAFVGNPSVSNAGPDQIVCGNAAVLAGNAPSVGAGTWSIVSGAGGSVTTPSSPTSAFTGVAGTVYTLRWTITNSPCAPTFDDVQITLTPSPTIANAGPDQNICGITATLAANSPTVGTGSWSIVSGAGGSVATPTSPTSTFTGVAGQVYVLRWTITNSPCPTSFDDVQISTDLILPSITCPSNISVNATSGTCAAVVNYTAPVGRTIALLR
ncbi:MAG: hypothetical protein IPN95_27900 [Bacteroidetes bacterium]|nr:hypothetical protein [Bacteroidota bacterium]